VTKETENILIHGDDFKSAEILNHFQMKVLFVETLQYSIFCLHLHQKLHLKSGQFPARQEFDLFLIT